MIPLGLTACLPAFLTPMLGIADGTTATTAFFNPVIFVMLGGFTIGQAMERWSLQKRIALKLVANFGGSLKKNLLGLMVVTFCLSSVLSNSATAVGVW